MNTSSTIRIVALLLMTVSLFSLGQEKKKPNLILLTLDTTRADVLGAYGARHGKTPYLDLLANNGVIYQQAITPSPLTLPAHTSLMTGKTPLEHGIQSNGTAALAESATTLAEVLKQQGYTTGAFIASQVLDRRFGLSQGFDFYADEINAADMGSSGYPERPAEAVVEDAIAFAGKHRGKPLFLWLHFYDPHAPYGGGEHHGEGALHDLYAEDVGAMDRAIGRFLQIMPGGDYFLAAVGDHGEMLGEHGEEEHGILLYRAALHVPLFIKGPGVPKLRIEETVGSERLPATLLNLMGYGEHAASFGPALPGFAFSPKEHNLPVYSEAYMPLNAYGWAPLEAITRGSHRLIVGPDPELYDFIADPTESKNLLRTQRDEARQLRDLLRGLKETAKKAATQTVKEDPQMDAALRSLGYVSGASRPTNDGIDPKEGVQMLADFKKARVQLLQGRTDLARSILEQLCERNPNNIPFLSRLAEAMMVQGDVEGALEKYHHAINLNPKLDMLHTNLGLALREIKDLDGAMSSFAMATRLNPKNAMAWLYQAEIAKLKEQPDQEHQILHHAMSHGVASAPLLLRLAQVEMSFQKWSQANMALEAATLLEPKLVPAWLLWGDMAVANKDVATALQRYGQARRADPENPSVYTRVGKIYVSAGDQKNARKYLEIAVQKGPKTAAGIEAGKLLGQLN